MSRGRVFSSTPPLTKLLGLAVTSAVKQTTVIKCKNKKRTKFISKLYFGSLSSRLGGANTHLAPASQLPVSVVCSDLVL